MVWCDIPWKRQRTVVCFSAVGRTPFHQSINIDWILQYLLQYVFQDLANTFIFSDSSFSRSCFVFWPKPWKGKWRSDSDTSANWKRKSARMENFSTEASNPENLVIRSRLVKAFESGRWDELQLKAANAKKRSKRCLKRKAVHCGLTKGIFKALTV